MHVNTGANPKAHTLNTIGGIPSDLLDLWMTKENSAYYTEECRIFSSGL